MFYEEEKINDALKCGKCNHRLDEPWNLPCGEIICSVCVSLIHVTNFKFHCLICDKMHIMPDDGLPKSKNLLTLISLQPSDVYRSQSVENLKELLNNIPEKITSLNFSINKGMDKIKEFCIDLRNEVQLTTEEFIQQMSNHRDKFIEEIDEFQKKTIQAYQPNEKSKEEFSETVKELENFHFEWSQYLKRTKISDQDILNAIEQANRLREKADQTKINLINFIFNGGILKFNKNSKNLEKSILGSLDLEIPNMVQSKPNENVLYGSYYEPCYETDNSDPCFVVHTNYETDNSDRYLVAHTNYETDNSDRYSVAHTNSGTDMSSYFCSKCKKCRQCKNITSFCTDMSNNLCSKCKKCRQCITSFWTDMSKYLCSKCKKCRQCKNIRSDIDF